MRHSIAHRSDLEATQQAILLSNLFHHRVALAHLLLGAASQDAVLQGQEFGLRFSPTGYEFSVLDPVTGEWSVLPAGDLYGPRELGQPYWLELELDGRRVDLAAAGSRSERDAYQPQVFLFSSEDISPFRLTIERRPGGQRIRIGTDERNRIELVRDGR